MKQFIGILVAVLLTVSGVDGYAQKKSSKSLSEPVKIFTAVYANSDDGFVNVRSEPSVSGDILTEMHETGHGIPGGILLEKGRFWSKVSVYGVVGWCNNRYLSYKTWYEGNGGPTLVSKNDNTTIYGDDLSGEERYPVYFKIPKDIIIADTEFSRDGRYYVLVTSGDALRVLASDVYVR